MADLAFGLCSVLCAIVTMVHINSNDPPGSFFSLITIKTKTNTKEKRGKEQPLKMILKQEKGMDVDLRGRMFGSGYKKEGQRHVKG